jgi:hypothetical protein
MARKRTAASMTERTTRAATSAGNPLLEGARRYARQNRPVFPCKPAAKVPLTGRGLLDATTDELVIAGWWQRWPDANVAIKTGRDSRLVVLDVDGEIGSESLGELERVHGELPRTATVVTPGGGQHFYFKHPGLEVRNSAGALAPGLDIRGDGGYVMAPPSIGPAGRRYEPDERAGVAVMPEWLREQATTPGDIPSPAPTTEWLRIVHGLGAGERNHGLARLTGHLLRRYVDVDLVAELVHLVNGRCQPPLPTAEVDRILESIAGRELRRRHGARR